MTTSTALDRGRTAYREHRFADAVAGLDEADREHAVAASDLEHLAIAAILVGRFEEGIDALTRAHEAYLAEDDVDAATRCAAWLGIQLMGPRGPCAAAGGSHARNDSWSRTRRPTRPRIPVHPRGPRRVLRGDGERAAAAFDRAGELARAFHDADLIALAGTRPRAVADHARRSDAGLA